jgi:hypothetical protein
MKDDHPSAKPKAPVTAEAQPTTTQPTTTQTPAAAPKRGTAPTAATAPSPALAKGGGIRGLGEKFAAHLVSGTASLTVPIATTPSRNGFGPELSLGYDSAAGNTPFGLGWRLSVPSITRKTDKGLPQYRDSEESDGFILSGAEDLVPKLDPSGSSWVRDMIEDANLRIDRYRPRIEGLFARIERIREKATGNVYWRTTTKDNITSLYGKTAAARIADPKNPKRIFSWLIERTQMLAGR